MEEAVFNRLVLLLSLTQMNLDADADYICLYLIKLGSFV